MMYSFRDHSKEAQKYRLRQWVANSAISGRDTTAEKVRNLASYYKVKRSTDYPDRLADAVNRLEGIEGDDTLSLIADLMRAGILNVDEANDFTLAHVRETRDDLPT